MSAATHRTLIIACGALAKEIVFLKNGLLKNHLLKSKGARAGVQIDLQCLPADYHNTPDKIVPGLRAVLEARAGHYDRILIGYGDCGTGGGLDRLLDAYPHATRLAGAHCYAAFAGLERFEQFMDAELGSFFLTDYLVQFFDRLIIEGLGLDRFPHLLGTYFKHYKKLIYLSQIENPALVAKAEAAAERLGLEFEHHAVGFGGLEAAMTALVTPLKMETAHA